MSMDFRSRSADVRREAADILWRFRSSRAARRAGTPTDRPDDPAPTPTRPGLPVSPATEALIRSALGSSEAIATPVRPEGPQTGASHDIAAFGMDEAVPQSGTDMRAAVIGTAEAAVSTMAKPPPLSPDQIAAEGPDTSADGSGKPFPARGEADGMSAAMHDAGTAAAGTAGAHDLTDLPGVGAGLVWLLGRCEVHTLADLASADATRLEQDLGLVGQLLDLPSWIELARQAIETKGKSAT